MSFIRVSNRFFLVEKADAEAFVAVLSFLRSFHPNSTNQLLFLRLRHFSPLLSIFTSFLLDLLQRSELSVLVALQVIDP